MLHTIYAILFCCNCKKHGLGWHSQKARNKLSRVFVTQENPKVNIVSAVSFGELVALTNPFDQMHLNPARLIAEIRLKIRGFSDDDWLLAMGDPAIIGVAFAIASENNGGRVSLLKWDKMEKTYYPVKIDLRGGSFNQKPDEET